MRVTGITHGNRLIQATSENLGIKACGRDKSGVYTRKVNEHFVEGAQRRVRGFRRLPTPFGATFAMTDDFTYRETFAKPPGAPAARRQSPEKCGQDVLIPAKPEGFTITSRVYQDEPIVIAAVKMETLTPPKYRAMRKLAANRGPFHEFDPRLFYEQGKLMEDFEDDYNYQGKFAQYFPTYQSMNDRQLRGYFSWRTKVRRGVIDKTSLSFVFVYIYELLNQLGVRSPEEGFHTLKNFWSAYKEIDSYINSYIKLWFKDYIVYNNLDKTLLEDLPDTNINNAVSTLLNCRSRGADEVFSALNSLSSYNLVNSRFFKQHPDDVKSVTFAVFSSLSDYYDKIGKDALFEKFFGKFYTRPYYMFKSAVFYDRLRHKDFIYEINEFYKYMCRDGRWICNSFFRYAGGNNQQISILLKNIDSLMRQTYSFEPAIKAGEITALLHAIIIKAIDEYQENKRSAARPKIEIDVSKLQNIRKASLETQSKLLVEEPKEAETPEFFDIKAASESDSPAQAINQRFLSDTEYFFMKCLLYGHAYDNLVKSKGFLLSVLVDAVNEKLFDRFGDTVITETEGRPELIADYVEELKEIIKE